MVIAILSFVLSCVSLYTRWWLSIPGLILGIIAIAKEGNDFQKAFGIAGMITSSSTLAVLIVLISLARMGLIVA